MDEDKIEEIQPDGTTDGPLEGEPDRSPEAEVEPKGTVTITNKQGEVLFLMVLPNPDILRIETKVTEQTYTLRIPLIVPRQVEPAAVAEQVTSDEGAEPDESDVKGHLGLAAN